MTFLLCSILAFCSLMLSPAGFAQEPSPATSPTIVLPSIPPNADAATATRAWLDTVPADKKASSDSYFEGGYWLLLWDCLLAVAISLFLLHTRISAGMRDFAERTTRSRILQVAIYAVAYLLLVSVLSFPMSVYENFFREHAYNLSTQTFGAWFGEQVTALIVLLIGFTLLMIALYGVFRGAPKTWWLWGTGIVICFFIIGAFIAPIYIEPLFNKYKPLTDSKISEPILAMAAANQIPVKQVFEVDASRQSNRVSANVAGFLGTTRIALNDNLLKQCSLPEIRQVMAHEMGHYVLNHMTKAMISLTPVVLIAFGVIKVAFSAAVRRWGTRWQVRDISDVAGLPLLALIVSVISLLATPLTNTMTRVAEIEADAFGINTSREPDGMASVALKLGTYRKLDPGPLEEFVFFDHPSGRARIRMAMDWKAAHLPAGH